ncbi:hypothetical protein [Persicirhabdus sediminis]|uniref:Uncharacterized protein n=1 Tax=Persicirhabdus sediminis TaxID=454144 RepID=A0A8J7MAG5_9BACT|nr:hypothetical protein [Persicirhabdus sediminis]MBK1789537.1 hypothetical protein [Persicirhabdus sediminis]
MKDHTNVSNVLFLLKICLLLGASLLSSCSQYNSVLNNKNVGISEKSLNGSIWRSKEIDGEWGLIYMEYRFTEADATLVVLSNEFKDYGSNDDVLSFPVTYTLKDNIIYLTNPQNNESVGFATVTDSYKSMIYKDGEDEVVFKKIK